MSGSRSNGSPALDLLRSTTKRERAEGRGTLQRQRLGQDMPYRGPQRDRRWWSGMGPEEEPGGNAAGRGQDVTGREVRGGVPGGARRRARREKRARGEQSPRAREREKQRQR